ncbi:unnamed protein product [Peronospora destructor]|uniref:Apoptosis-antagonizing transcription factor C-terminal domain-containing protein n=1 Tax=Peronospora destructor TaxID=86335 RepID=A0AAV0V879_9STRA|nr:unnamed protein product [Peronospora destructor]
MTHDEFNIDTAEDFDDGTRALTHDNAVSDSNAVVSDSTRLCLSRKQRLQTTRHKSIQQQEKASVLRVKNWDTRQLESKEYAGQVVTRKDLKEDGSESPDEDAIADWSEAEPFEESESESEEEEEEGEKEKESNEMLIRGFQKEDSARLMDVQDSEKVAEKAKHVRNQKLIWERCLEVQIYTKRLLMTEKDAVARDVTDGEATDEEVVMNRKERNWSRVVQNYRGRVGLAGEIDIATSSSAMLPQYSEILSTYTRKTDLAAGGKINQANKFKAVNQGILAQLESVLVDPQRVKRKAHAPLDVPEADAAEGAEELLDELMYDDSDFYQQLLKEFIESGGGGAGQDGMVRRTHRKKKKVVNRKASKGRQLRYTVHPKLENFMFPEPYPKPEMDVTELFRSLFGQVRQ